MKVEKSINYAILELHSMKETFKVNQNIVLKHVEHLN